MHMLCTTVLQIDCIEIVAAINTIFMQRNSEGRYDNTFLQIMLCYKDQDPEMKYKYYDSV